MKFIDLSVSMEPFLPCDPPENIPKIRYLTHEEAFPGFAECFGLNPDEVPEADRFGWAGEYLTLGGHSGTHLDAPWHFYPTMNGGEPAWTIDQVPLEWCYGHGVILDFSDKKPGYKLTVEDFEEALRKIDYTIQPGDIVFIQSGAGPHWGQADFMGSACGVSKEATRWLLDQGVHITGTDAWSWDVPQPYTVAEFKETHNYDCIWESHRVSRDKAYGHIEKLTNLDQVPPTGSTICCFPIKIKGGSAGWTRVVAIVNE